MEFPSHLAGLIKYMATTLGIQMALCVEYSLTHRLGQGFVLHAS